MKSTQKITRVHLKSTVTENSILLGLVSADPDYKLSLTLNKKFRISLRNMTPVKITDDSGSVLTFSRFSDLNASPHTGFNLISNRSGKNFLLKKLKNIDYLLQIQDPENENSVKRITASLREIESVNAVFNIDLNTLKDKNLQYLTQ